MWNFIEALLTKLGLRRWPVEEVYCSYVLGEIPADGVYAFLKPDQVDAFIDLHEAAKQVVEGGDQLLPDLVVLHLAELLVKDRARFVFAMGQVDALIERDIEKNIFRRRGEKNVVKREV